MQSFFAGHLLLKYNRVATDVLVHVQQRDLLVEGQHVVEATLAISFVDEGVEVGLPIFIQLYVNLVGKDKRHLCLERGTVLVHREQDLRVDNRIGFQRCRLAKLELFLALIPRVGAVLLDVLDDLRLGQTSDKEVLDQVVWLGSHDRGVLH